MQLLFDIIPMLGSVMLLCFFMFLAFALVGVQMWKGILRQGCYDSNEELYRPMDGVFLCSTIESGLHHCPPPEAQNFTQCLQGAPLMHAGAISFDNILVAFSTIFQAVTLEGWTRTMTALQDTYSFWVWPFFVMLIFLGSWLAVNLALVVIATQFQVTKQRYVPIE